MAVDYEELATRGMSAEQLAVIFLREYFSDKEISYPINPFQILTDLGVPFMFRPFNKYEGINFAHFTVHQNLEQFLSCSQ